MLLPQVLDHLLELLQTAGQAALQVEHHPELLDPEPRHKEAIPHRRTSDKYEQDKLRSDLQMIADQ